MTLAFDFVVSGVIAIISVIVHVMAIELFAPGTGLHMVASSGTELMNGAARADRWYQIFAIWIPLGGLFVSVAWPLVRSYRRQSATAYQRVP